MRQKREHIIVTTGQVILDIRDVERVINVSIWGDD